MYFNYSLLSFRYVRANIRLYNSLADVKISLNRNG